MGWKARFFLNGLFTILNAGCLVLNIFSPWWPSLILNTVAGVLCGLGAWYTWQDRPKGSTVL